MSIKWNAVELQKYNCTHAEFNFISYWTKTGLIALLAHLKKYVIELDKTKIKHTDPRVLVIIFPPFQQCTTLVWIQENQKLSKYGVEICWMYKIRICPHAVSLHCAGNPWAAALLQRHVGGSHFFAGRLDKTLPTIALLVLVVFSSLSQRKVSSPRLSQRGGQLSCFVKHTRLTFFGVSSTTATNTNCPRWHSSQQNNCVSVVIAG